VTAAIRPAVAGAEPAAPVCALRCADGQVAAFEVGGPPCERCKLPAWQHRLADYAAPTRIAATFTGGSLGGKWSYLPAGAPEYTSPGWGERYLLEKTVWHSHEDDVMSHQVYALRPVLFAPREATAEQRATAEPSAQQSAPRAGWRGAR
jgi:hypothetical protein